MGMQKVVDHRHSAVDEEMALGGERDGVGERMYGVASMDAQSARISPVRDVAAAQAAHENRMTNDDWHSVVEAQLEVQIVNGSG